MSISENTQQAGAIEKLTKEVAKGGGIAFIGQGIGRLFSLLLQILLARVLGPAGYGLYALGLSVLGIARRVASLGLQNGVVKFGAMYRGAGNKARLKGTLLLAIGISFGSAWVVALVLYFLANLIAKGVFNEPRLAGPLRLFAFALPFYTLMTVTSFSTRAFRRIDYDVAISQLSRPFFTLLVTGASFLLGYRLMGAVAGFLVSTVVSAGLGLYLMYRLFPDLTSHLKTQYEPKVLLGYSFIVLFVGMSNVLLMRIDRIMLGILGSAKDVGIYNAAANLAMQATLFLASFSAIFSPIIADLFHQGRVEELGALFKTTTKWIFTLTLPVVLILVLFAKPIMRVFGPEFVTGAPVLISLGVAQFVNASVGSVGLMLTMTGRQKLMLMNSLALGGLNVLLNFLLIPRFGMLGAGIATGLSFALVNLAKLIEVYLLYKVHPYKLSYWKPVIAGVAAMVSLVGFSSVLDLAGWLGGVCLFGLVYFFVLVLVGFDREDRLIIQGVKRRVRRRLTDRW